MQWDIVQGMAQSFSPASEIASAIGLSLKDLNRASKAQKGKKLDAYMEQQYCIARADIRRMQMENAETGKGNPRMLIWLGMQHLSQTPNVVELNTPGNKPAEEQPKSSGHRFLYHKGDRPMIPAQQTPEPPKPTEKPIIAVEAILMAEELGEPLPNLVKKNQEREMVISAHTGEPIDG